MNRKVVLISGASSGIGKECANYLHTFGYKVYGTSRTFNGSNSYQFLDFCMDVNKHDSVKRAISTIIEKEGRIDVVVNSAGYSLAGAIENTSIDEAKAQLETNFFGVLRVCQEVLPFMRLQNSGLIINISSIAGLLSVPYQGMYSASKYALEGMTESLRMEVQSFGIKVVLIEPGNFNTKFKENRVRTMESRKNNIYKENLEKAVSIMENDECKGAHPASIAHLVGRLINEPNPKLRYTVGTTLERVVVGVKRFLLYRLYEWGMMKYFQLC